MPIGSGAFIAGSAIAAAAGVGGGIASNIAASNLNSRNRRWQEEQNEKNRTWQSSERVAGQQWTEDMYNKYDSVAAQKRQYEQAGINPYLADGTLSSGQMMTPPNQGSPSNVGAPSSVPPTNVMQGVPNIMNGVMMASQNELQRSEAMNNLVKTSIDIYKNIGESAGRKFFEENVASLGSDGQSRATEMYNQMLQGVQLDNARKDFDLGLDKELSKKERETMIMFTDQSVTKIVAEIGRMHVQNNLDEKSIEELGARMAKEYAEAGYFKALGNQISTLLPLIKSQLLFSAASQGLTFLTQNAEFVGDTGKRDYMMSGEGQKRRTFNYQMQPEGNYVQSFIQGFVKDIPQLKMSFDNSYRPYDNNSYLHLNNYGTYNYNK